MIINQNKTINKDNPFEHPDPILCRVFSLENICFPCKVSKILYPNEKEKDMTFYKEGDIQYRAIFKCENREFGVKKFLTGVKWYLLEELGNSSNDEECKIKKQDIENCYKIWIEEISK